MCMRGRVEFVLFNKMQCDALDLGVGERVVIWGNGRGTCRPQTVNQFAGKRRACFSHATGVSKCSGRPCCTSVTQALQCNGAGKLRGTAKG